MQQEKEIIRKLQRQEKDEKELEKQRALLEAQQEKKERRRQAVTMEQLMKANTRQDDFTHRETTERDKDDQVLGIPKDGSKRQFYNKFRKVVDEADIILEVLDARFLFLFLFLNIFFNFLLLLCFSFFLFVNRFPLFFNFLSFF